MFAVIGGGVVGFAGLAVVLIGTRFMSGRGDALPDRFFVGLGLFWIGGLMVSGGYLLSSKPEQSPPASGLVGPAQPLVPELRHTGHRRGFPPA